MTISNFFSPQTTDEAVSLLAEYLEAKSLAGGTDWLVQQRIDAIKVSTVVDLKRIPGLIGVEQTGDTVRIGAATPAAQLTRHPLLIANYPGLVKGIDYIGSTQIQGRCTLGGNLCNASPAADTVPAMIANEAEAIVVGPSGERRVAVVDFAVGPGRTILSKGEFVTAIELPLPEPDRADAYLRFTPRTEMDIAVVSAGVSLRLDGDTIRGARVAVGAVAATALRLDAAAEMLDGVLASQADFSAFQQCVSDAVTPISDKRGTAWFRKQIIGVITVRAVENAVAACVSKGEK